MLCSPKEGTLKLQSVTLTQRNSRGLEKKSDEWTYEHVFLVKIKC